VSGRSKTDLVDNREEKFQLNVPCTLSEGILLQDTTATAVAINPMTAIFKIVLTEFFIVENN